MNIQISKIDENYIVILKINLTNNNEIIETNVNIEISSNGNADIKVKGSSYKIDFFKNMLLNLENIKTITLDNLPKIKTIAATLLIAGTLSTISANETNISSVETSNHYSKSFSTQLSLEVNESVKINNLVKEIQSESFEIFKTLTNSDNVSEVNTFINLKKYGTISGEFSGFNKHSEFTIEDYKKTLSDRMVSDEIIEQIDFSDKGILNVDINEKLLKLAIDEPDKYKEDVKKLIINLFLHELTHKYGDKNNKFGEKAASLNQIFELEENSPLIKIMTEITTSGQYYKSDMSRKIELFEMAFSDEGNNFRETPIDITPKTLEINKIILSNLEKIFRMDNEKMSYLSGKRESNFKGYMNQNEYLENIIGNDDYKNYTDNGTPISAGFLFNINKLLVDNGYSNNEIKKYNKDYLCKKELIIAYFDFNEENFEIEEVEKKVEGLINKVSDKVLDLKKETLISKTNTINEQSM